MSRRARRKRLNEKILLKRLAFRILLGITGVCWGVALLPELTTGKKTGASWELFVALVLSACLLILLAVNIFFEIRKDPEIFLKNQHKTVRQFRQMYPFIPSAFRIKVRPLGYYRLEAALAIVAGIFVLLIALLMLMDLLESPIGVITIP